MSHLRVDGADLYYEHTPSTSGSDDRVVLTHGAWTDARTWTALCGHLANRFDLVVWDRRGHSRSAPHRGSGSVQEDATDLAAIIEHLGGGEPVFVVGNSAGGSVALNLVTMRPDLVRAAAVHEPGPFGIIAGTDDPHLKEVMESDKEVTAQVEEMIAAGEHRRAAEHFVERLIGDGSWEQFPEALRNIMAANAPTVPDDVRDGWDAESVDIAALAASTIPLLISTGPDSPELERAAAYELGRRVPHARVATLEGGHIPHRANTAEYAALLTAFFDQSATHGEGE